jgi:hypothetical protein
MEDGPPHSLVEERADDPAVHRAVIALVPPLWREDCLGAVLGHVEVEVQPGVVEAAARKTPMLEVDAKFRESRH